MCPSYCAGELETQHQCDRTDSRSGGLQCGGEQHHQHRNSTTGGISLLMCRPSCLKTSMSNLCRQTTAIQLCTAFCLEGSDLHLGCQAQTPRSRNCWIQHTLLLLFPPFNMPGKIKHIAFPTDTQNEK